MRKCTKCNIQYENEVLFCKKCSRGIPKTGVCIHCGREVLGDGNVCQTCTYGFHTDKINLVSKTKQNKHFLYWGLITAATGIFTLLLALYIAFRN
jgi:hypothetical protein